jgi:peptidase, U32 family
MKKAELLAPAGNMEALIAAVQAGCDAVYLGLNSFSARAFAGNFSREELIEAVRYCHIRGVKVYVTMNTILYEPEIEAAKDQIQFLYDHDVDALLIQDFGLFHYVRTCFPDFEVHCSTQMHVHNMAGIEYMKTQGVKRVVLARETPIELVKKACKSGMEIEVFAYGAICISYSGQCQFSVVTKQRSANRGMCAQCCRMKYYKEDGSEFEEGEYILSPKDLNVIDQLPKLLGAGVSSLKIEGRMKRPEYVWLITKTFREAIDAYYRNETYRVTKKRQEELKLMFNRGFSEGHLFHDDVTKRMSQYRPNHQGVVIGEVVDFYKGKVKVKLSKPLYQHDGLRILSEPEDIGLTAVKIYDQKNLLVNSANPGQIVTLECKEGRPKREQKLHKTTDTRLLDEVQHHIDEFSRLVDITVSYEARIGKPLKLIVSDGEHTIIQESLVNLELAKNAPLTREKIEAALAKTGASAYRIIELKGEIEHIFLPVSVINETRRLALEKLDNLRAIQHIRLGKQAYHYHTENVFDQNYKYIIQTKKPRVFDCESYLNVVENDTVTPVIHESQEGKATLINTVVSQVGDFNNKLVDCIGGMTLNVVNSYAIAYVLSIPGIKGVILSEEMNDLQIEKTLDAFKQRYGFQPPVYKFVYGKRTLMHIKDSFTNQQNLKFMSDLRGNRYEISYNANEVSILESSAFKTDNPFCMGNYLILDDETIDLKSILEDK